MTQDVQQVIAPDGLGYFITSNHVSSNYFSTDGIEREGNGFVLYQNNGGNLIVVPGLTKDKSPLLTTKILEKGKMIGNYRDTLIWKLLEQQYPSLNAVDIMSAKAKHPDSIYEMLKELGII